MIERGGPNWKWHYLESNHAKAIIYHKQKVAILGSFNVTEPSLGKNIECSHQVDETGYRQLTEEFQAYWDNTWPDKRAFGTQATWQAVDLLMNHTEEAETRTEAASSLDGSIDGSRKPWPFQEDIIQQVMTWLDAAPGADLGRIVKLPTGAGKTLVAAEAIRRLLEKKPQARILWVCHRVELLRQSVEMIKKQINGAIPDAAWFIPQHIEDESKVRDRNEFPRSKDSQLVFCTQGMLPHLLKPNRQKGFDLTVVDECHRFHKKSGTYRDLYKFCNKWGIPRLGLTATPLADEKRGFGQYWDTEAMFGKDVKKEDLVQNGFLSRLCRSLTGCRQTNHIFASKQQHAGPEHLESELVTRIREFNNDEVNRAVAKAWEQYRGKRQRVLCFAVTIEHAKTLKQRFFAGDDCVQTVHSKMDPLAVRMSLEWFKEPVHESRMLVSVLMLAEGIDLPKTDCLFMVRPTFSPELYQQMIGRGFRGPEADGTEDCAIVDFTSQFVDRNGQVLEIEQETTKLESDVVPEMDRIEPEDNEEPADLDASGRISTVRDLKEAVADLQDEKSVTIQDACEELAQELDYKASTLVNYLYTKPDDYPLGWEDPETDPAERSDDSHTATGRGSEVNGQRIGTFKVSEDQPGTAKGYVTSNKLLDLRAYNPQHFEEIASLTNVASSTLRSYCSHQENFRRWRTNNRDKMDQVLRILCETLDRDSDAA